MDGLTLLLVITVFFFAMGGYFATLPPPAPPKPSRPHPLYTPLTLPPVLRSNVNVARLLRQEAC